MSERFEVSVAVSIDNIELVKLIKKYHENLFNSDMIASIEKYDDNLEIANSHIYLVVESASIEYIFSDKLLGESLGGNIDLRVSLFIDTIVELFDLNPGIKSDYLENKDQILESLKKYMHFDTMKDNTEIAICGFDSYLEEYEKEIKELIPDVSLQMCSYGISDDDEDDFDVSLKYVKDLEKTISCSLVEGELIYSEYSLYLLRDADYNSAWLVIEESNGEISFILEDY
jgi:NurA-like 5'-3' nuclease